MAQQPRQPDPEEYDVTPLGLKDSNDALIAIEVAERELRGVQTAVLALMDMYPDNRGLADASKILELTLDKMRSFIASAKDDGVVTRGRTVEIANELEYNIETIKSITQTFDR